MRSLALVLLALVAMVSAWADTGHVLVAELARRTAGPEVAAKVNAAMESFVEYFPPDATRLPYAATFMDLVKRDTQLFDNLHYVDFPHKLDGDFTAPEPESVNILMGMEQIGKTMINAGAYTGIWGKGFCVLLALHIMGDMHQPLHAVSLFSQEMNFLPPVGDMGGNLYAINYTSEFGMEFPQVHLLFDCVMGLWCTYMPHPVTAQYSALIQTEADRLEEEFPRSSFDQEEIAPAIATAAQLKAASRVWARESFEEAKRVYARLPPIGGTPDAQFISDYKTILRRRIALGGYRLGHVLSLFNYDKNGLRPDDSAKDGVNANWRSFAIAFGLLSLAMLWIAVYHVRKARAAAAKAMQSASIPALGANNMAESFASFYVKPPHGDSSN